MSIFKKIYGMIALITLALGFVVAILFLIAIIIGGNQGELIAVFAGDVMNWCIKLAAIAVLFGIIDMYIRKEHSLTMKSEEKKDDKLFM
ncbi:hypothetical protein MKX78_21865 [Cytobacillus sp. FSL R5-0569]|uniref:hypothetical protein n=1 Tax=Cytobacillus TaxID=2675230 RepID=UPI0027807877|nr:hypothetical protein [Cytobacillus kochii]MDQ0185891.1 hypothetical protein [Cytobacillus kochii]